jgi:hypothetical protein
VQGYALVDFTEADAASTAMSGLQGRNLDGKTLLVNFASAGVPGSACSAAPSASSDTQATAVAPAGEKNGGGFGQAAAQLAMHAPCSMVRKTSQTKFCRAAHPRADVAQGGGGMMMGSTMGPMMGMCGGPMGMRPGAPPWGLSPGSQVARKLLLTLRVVGQAG